MATISFQMTSSPLTGTKTFTGTDVDMQDLLDWASIFQVALIQALAPAVSFTASIAGTALTVSAVTTGALAVGQYIYGPGVQLGTRIVSGSGLAWVVNNSQTVPLDAMTANTAGQVGSSLATATIQQWKGSVQNWKSGLIVPAAPAQMTWG